jgi:hypothetical protein
MTRATDPAGGRFSSQAKKRLIATHANSRIAATRSQQRTSYFLIATKTALLSLPQAYSPSRLYRPERGARMFHSIKQRSAIPGGAIQ